MKQRTTRRISHSSPFMLNDFSDVTDIMFYAPFEVLTNEQLKSVGIWPSAVPDIFRPLTFNRYGVSFTGIGMLNENGGYEFWNPSFDHPVSLVKPGLSFIPSKVLPKSNVCIVFSNILDYLCFRTLLADKALPEAWQLPYEEYSDTFILNAFSNFLSLQKAVEKYHTIHTFFPVADYGKVMNMTLSGVNPRNEDKLHDWSGLFSPIATSLHDFVRTYRRNVVDKG